MRSSSILTVYIEKFRIGSIDKGESMKKKKQLLIISILILLVVYITTSALSEYGTYTEDTLQGVRDYIAEQASDDDSEWEVVVGEDVVLENQDYLLTLDHLTTRFTVLDKRTNTSYASFPSEELNIISEEDRARGGSNLSIMYYDSTSKEHYMGAGNDSVSKEQFEIKLKDDRIRIYYTLGTSVSDLFVPVVFTKDMFENDILPSLQSDLERRRIKLYYDLYSKDDPDDDFNAIASRYPVLNQQDLYVLTDAVDENIQKDISGYITGSGYTTGEYEEMLKELNIEASNDNVPVGFQIPLELSLNDDGFTAAVLTDRITENNDFDKLVKVYVLEYFGAVGADANGFFLVPDGSGSIIDMNQQEPQNYTQHYYNDDLAIPKTEQTQLSRNISLPIFGQSSDSGSFLAVIEKSVAAASLCAKTMGAANPVNNIYCAFDLCSFTQTDIGQDRNMSSFNIYAKHILYESPTISYILLSGDTSSVSDMASVYRARLLEEGVLGEKLNNNDQMPLYIDFLCMATQKTNILGINYDKDLVLSDLGSIIEVVTDLHKRGINNLQIRLKGWNDGGLYNELPGRFDLDAKVGTKEELTELADLLFDTGGQLFLDLDLTFTSRNKAYDNVKLSLDVSRTLDRTVASVQNYDLAALKYSPALGIRYIITPMSYKKYISEFKEDIAAAGIHENVKFSWSSGGMYLSSDFNPNADLDMPMAADMTAQAFRELSDMGTPMASDYGYSYVLPYVTDLINVPLSYSSFMAQTGSVPFYQMVVSGYKNYSGPALNMTDRSLEMTVSASAPYYLLMTGDDKLLKLADLDQRYFSLDYRKSIDDLEELYNEMNASLGSVYGSVIVRYEELADKVTCTVFENGEIIITNRSQNEIDYNGNMIPADSYLLIES